MTTKIIYIADKYFNDEQANEDIHNLLIYKPRAKKIEKEISEMLEGLK